MTTIEMLVPATRHAAQQRSWTAAKLDSYIQDLIRRRRRLINIAAIYQEDPEIFPLQVVAAQHHLSALRRRVNEVKAYLGTLEPAETQRLKPWPVIMRLGSTDYHLTELLLTIVMFGPICQSPAPERVRIHMDIRAAFVPLLTAYDDTLSQLNALVQKARQMEKEA